MKASGGKVIGFITILISLLVAGTLSITAINIYTRGKRGQSQTTAAIEQAKNIECRSQIRKIETTVKFYYFENSAYPERLEDLRDLSPQNFYCPVTQRAYCYDPNSGRVDCPDHP